MTRRRGPTRLSQEVELIDNTERLRSLYALAGWQRHMRAKINAVPRLGAAVTTPTGRHGVLVAFAWEQGADLLRATVLLPKGEEVALPVHLLTPMEGNPNAQAQAGA